MRYHDSILDLIGGTPLVRLDRLTSTPGALVLAKLESANPGGSAKDRIALRMIEAAEADGLLGPGGTIVEPTSGNTGVGLAMVALRKGYRCVFTVPDKVSEDKIAVLRAYGAEVVICPAARHPDHPESYRATAIRLAKEIPGAFRPDQYANAANPASHYATTGPEIWRDTGGRLTHFVAGVGTGGTISGTGRYLKEVSDGRVCVIGADPVGSVYTDGGGRPYLIEGVGQLTFPEAYDPGVPDEIVGVNDQTSITMTRRLAREEGILTGGSGGMVVAAALRVAAEAGPQAVVVVLVPDSGRGYLSKIFDEEWVWRHGFEQQPGDGPRVGDLRHRGLITVNPRASVGDAISLMATAGLTHLPVTGVASPVRLAEITGTCSEADLAVGFAAGRVRRDDPVHAHLSPPLPIVGRGQLAAEAAATITRSGAALVVDGGLPVGVILLRDLLTLETMT